MSLSIHSHTHTIKQWKNTQTSDYYCYSFLSGCEKEFLLSIPYRLLQYSTVARSVPTILLMHTPQLPGLYLLYYSCIHHSCQVCTYYTTHAYSTVAMSVPTRTYAYSTVAMSVPTIILNTHAFSLLSGSIQSTYSMYRGSCPTGSY